MINKEKAIKEEFKLFGISYKKSEFRDIEFLYKREYNKRSESIGEIRGLSDIRDFIPIWEKKKRQLLGRYKIELELLPIFEYDAVFKLIKEIQNFLYEEERKRDKAHYNESYALPVFEDYLQSLKTSASQEIENKKKENKN